MWVKTGISKFFAYKFCLKKFLSLLKDEDVTIRLHEW